MLTEGQTLPYDRTWAVAHDASKVGGSTWAPCQNFSRGSKAPALMAINAQFDDNKEHLTLSHPNRPAITFHPDTESERFIDWVMPLVPQNRALPDRVLRLDKRGFTDSDFPSVSFCNMASHHAVEALAQSALSPLRWRNNIWFEGIPAWEEFDWVGRDITLGGAVLHIEEPIVRCLATAANPLTGERDIDTLGTLKIMDHQNFGIYARVVKTGTIAVGDTVRVI